MVPAAPAAASTPTDPRERIEAYLDKMEAFGFSGVVGIVHGGHLLLARPMGFSDMETATPFTLDTGFFIASLSKQFTAALILALEDRGLLRSDDLVAEHLDGVPPEMRTMTIRHLLGHTSGLLRLKEAPDGTFASGEEVLAAGLAATLENAPGGRFDYSNAGYAFLAALAEHIAGKPYEALARELLFEPASMRETSMVTDRAFWKGRRVAVGYNGFLSHGDALLARSYGRDLIGPAGVVTTMSDLLEWEAALRKGDILSPESRRKLFTPGLENYACGWSVWDSKLMKERVAAHDGHIMPEGFNAYHLRMLESGGAVIVLSNRGDVALAERLSWQLAGILAGNEAPPMPPLVPSDVAPSPGSYRADDGAHIRIHQIADHFFLEPMDQAAANLFLDSVKAVTEVSRRVEGRLAAAVTVSGDPVGLTVAAAKSQVTRFGPYQGQEVVYSVQEDGFVRTHLRHFLGRDTLYTRLDSAGGEVVGGTDEGAFLSGGRGLTPTLAYLGMAPAGKATWTAFDFWKERSIAVTIGPRTMSLHSHGRRVTFHSAATVSE
jgi:CubicO group peptidase (beta-lactamase class C family)